MSALTLLFQTEHRFRVIFIFIALLHEGFIHRDQLPGKLSIVLINGKPALTWKEVPIRTYAILNELCKLQIHWDTNISKVFVFHLNLSLSKTTLRKQELFLIDAKSSTHTTPHRGALTYYVLHFK